jgi:NADP-dependent 3-hydroxy acid dehydrogenase YdfG
MTNLIDDSLDGRVAVVTGAASGIGAATARRLAAHGAAVALLARRRERLEALAAELGDRALAVPVDVTDPEAVQRAAERVTEGLGRADLVVNNAGVMLAAPLVELRQDEWTRMLDTNLRGVLEIVRAFVPGLVEAAKDGPADLIDISSVGARVTYPGYAVYGATKAAVSYFSEAIRGELAPLGVRITNIEPGLTDSELREHVANDEARALVDSMFETIGGIRAEDVADLIAYVVTRPRNVSLPQLSILPTAQA